MATGVLIKAFFLCPLIVAVAFSEYPTGHLQPFGHHRPPTVPVDEFTLGNSPRPEEFYEKYVKNSIPAIFRNVLTESRAYSLWTDEYIRANFGELEVRLEGKHEKKHIAPVGEKYLGRDTLRHFVDTYHDSGNNVYIVSDMPEAMYRDMGVIPSMGACGEMSRRIIEVDIWWSGGGSYSIIHKDAYNQINCLLNGTKQWKMIEYKYEKDLYKYPEPEYELGGFSRVNPEAVDLIKHPNVQNIEWSNFTLYAGDCLFLPKNYYHQVSSEGTNNKAVSLLFSRFDKYDKLNFSDCTDENADFKGLKSLADFEVQWPWKGEGVMVMGNPDLVEAIRDLLLGYVKNAKETGKIFNFGFLEASLKGAIEDFVVPNVINRTLIFSDIDRDGDGIITKDEVRQMNFERLRNIVFQMERYEPSNHYEFEYSAMAFERVWALAKTCLSRYEEFTKDLWLQHYRQAGGSNLFGEEIFDRLAGDKAHVISADISEEDLYDALQNWVKYFAPQYSVLDSPPTDFAKRRQWFEAGMEELSDEGAFDGRPEETGGNGVVTDRDEL